MHILITSGTGFIGRRLVYHLIKHGHVVTVVSRQSYKPANLPAKINFAQWDGKSVMGWGHQVEEVDAIVNLTGAGLADARWTKERKKEIQESRTQAGKAIVEAINTANNKPKVLISSSAVGYYGPRQDEVITEESGPGDDFLAAEVCKRWEASTQAVEEMGVRRVVIRSGLVLDTKEGGFPKMLLPFRLFAGGPIGRGRQWLPWIHYYDHVDAIRFLIENEAARGPVNLTAPNPLRNRDFAKLIGEVMKRPAFIPTPGIALKIMFGEMSIVLLSGQRAVPKRLQELGYEFKFPEAEAALQDLLA